MSTQFDPQHGLVIVPAEFIGLSGTALLRLALDTGATGTLVNTALLVAIGYDPALVADRVQVTTGSGVEFVPRLPVQQITALGQVRTNFPVLCHTLPPMQVWTSYLVWTSCEDRYSRSISAQAKLR